MRHKLTIAFILFLGSLFIRYSLISLGPYHLDSLNLAIQSKNTLETLHLHPLFGFGYPFTVILSTLSLFLCKLFGNNDPVFAANLMSVVTSSLAVAVFYLIASEFLSSQASFLGSTLFSLTPIFLGISTFGMSHAPSVLFLLIAVWSLIQFQKYNNSTFYFLSILSLGLMGATRIQDLILITAPISFAQLLGIHTAKTKPRETIFKEYIIFWLSVYFIAFLLHLPFILEQGKDYNGQFNAFWQQGVTGNFNFLNQTSLPFTFSYLIETMTLVGFFGALIGLLLSIKKHLHLCIFLLLWILIPLEFYGNTNTTAPRFFNVILPPLFLGLSFLLDSFFKKNALFKTTALILFATILTISFSCIYPLLYLRHTHAFLPEYVEWVQKMADKNSAVIVGDDALFYKHYSPKLKPLFRPMDSNHIPEEQLKNFKKELDAALNEGKSVYISDVNLLAYNPDNIFSDLILKNYRVKHLGQKLYEDWHRDVMKKQIFYNGLYQLYPKTASAQ